MSDTNERTKKQRIEELERLVEDAIVRLNLSEDRVKALEASTALLASSLDRQYIRLTEVERCLGEIADRIATGCLNVETEKVAQRVSQLETEARHTPGWAGVANVPKGAPLPAEPNERMNPRANEEIRRTCALTEGSCKAADCPEHGWLDRSIDGSEPEPVSIDLRAVLRMSEKDLFRCLLHLGCSFKCRACRRLFFQPLWNVLLRDSGIK